MARLAKSPEGRETLTDDFALSDEQIDDAVGYEQDLAKLAAA